MGRKQRSTSIGGDLYLRDTDKKAKKKEEGDSEVWNKAQTLVAALLHNHVLCHSRPVLHSVLRDVRRDRDYGDSGSLVWAAALVEHCYLVDWKAAITAVANTTKERQVAASTSQTASLCCRQLLLATDKESGYTPLHWAVYQGDLPMILLLLSTAARLDEEESENRSGGLLLGHGKPFSTQRPMTLLQTGGSTGPSFSEGHSHKKHGGAFSSSSTSWVSRMTTAVDAEGLTPCQLLEVQQRAVLLAIRSSLYRPSIFYRPAAAGVIQDTNSRQRSNSFNFSATAVTTNEQNEFDLLSRSVQWMQQERRRQQQQQGEEGMTHQERGHQNCSTTCTTFGCEVLTFGRAHHCALGVVASSSSTSDQRHHMNEHHQTATFCPRRVQAFAQDTVGRIGGAVAVAAANHHTLVATKQGHLFAFGLGKGGRLGTGTEMPCALPTRVGGTLLSRFVVAVAAAENHSLCVTKCGSAYSWGSNRFGQLGWSNTGNGSGGDASPSNNKSSRCCTPRRVDDLKSVFCVAVAAGEKHSVALSKLGEVYVWGDNTAGQLGISRRSGTHRVQRVELLLNTNTSSQPRVCISIAASEQMTMALAVLASRHQGRRVNSIYVWGQGSHVPSRVQFEACSESRNRPINPVAIACARYHNVAITSDGYVYTWGLHADTLGTKKSTSTTSTATFSTPQLVTGMLPKHGGGIAAAVAASENHTAVVTDTGALFTWGATHGKNILGHEGVRWQQMPKRVPGVQRAVAVSAAKEHTVLLVGASFPEIPVLPQNNIASLETLATREAVKHVDLFNVLPVSILSDRFGNVFLKDYCSEFIRHNLDGVMNVCQKSVLNTFLTEQLAVGALYAEKYRDGIFHPLLHDLVFPGCGLSSGSLRLNMINESNEWLDVCSKIVQDSQAMALVEKYRKSSLRSLPLAVERNDRALSKSLPEEGTSSRCLELTTNMDLGTQELAQSKLSCLTKEVRAIRKRLSQIARLETGVEEGSVLSFEELEKVSRKPQLLDDLKVFENCLETVQSRLDDLCLLSSCIPSATMNEALNEPKKMNGMDDTLETHKSFRCELCKITCSDTTNFELHINGRKHRNRLVHAADQEQKQAASLMMMEQQRQHVMRNSLPTDSNITQKSNPWKNKASAVQPKYILPPPPIPVPHSIATLASSATSAKNSLAEIMAEESEKRAKSRKKNETLQVIAKATTKSHSNSAVSASSPTTKPAMANSKAAPWSSAHTYFVPSTPAVPVKLPSPDLAIKESRSLGDFITPTKNAPAVAALPGSWCGQGTERTNPSTPPAMSFAEIQRQEQAFKANEDHTFAANGKWFTERRERAGSFRDIEESAAKERDFQRFVAEQLQIEKQIEEENRKRVGKTASKKKSRNKNPKQRTETEDSSNKQTPAQVRTEGCKPCAS